MREVWEIAVLRLSDATAGFRDLFRGRGRLAAAVAVLALAAVAVPVLLVAASSGPGPTDRAGSYRSVRGSRGSRGSAVAPPAPDLRRTVGCRQAVAALDGYLRTHPRTFPQPPQVPGLVAGVMGSCGSAGSPLVRAALSRWPRQPPR